MLRYEVLREQWLLATLGGGLVLLLTTVASYLAIWRPRPGQTQDQSEDRKGHHPPIMTFFQALPAVLTLTYVGIAIFMLAYFVQKIFYPPNW